HEGARAPRHGPAAGHLGPAVAGRVLAFHDGPRARAGVIRARALGQPMARRSPHRPALTHVGAGGRQGAAQRASNVRPAMATTTSPLTAENVMALVQERDIRFIRLWFTDILGQLKAFSINATELTDAFEGGMGFDGSSITGFNPIEESDMIAMPDPTT